MMMMDNRASMKGERELYFKILWLNPIIAFKIIISAILSIINLVNIEFFKVNVILKILFKY